MVHEYPNHVRDLINIKRTLRTAKRATKTTRPPHASSLVISQRTHYKAQPQKPSASPPYFFGNSLGSITCDSSAPIVFGPDPTTDILARVAVERSGLNSQKTHVSSVGTLMKNLRDCVQTSRHGRCVKSAGEWVERRMSKGWEAEGRRREKRQRPDSEANAPRSTKTHQELRVVVLEDVRRFLRRRLLRRVALGQAHALVIWMCQDIAPVSSKGIGHGSGRTHHGSGPSGRRSRSRATRCSAP